jgi:hypothetical protein
MSRLAPRFAAAALAALALTFSAGTARAQCSHLGNTVVCPPGIPSGSGSLFFQNGFIVFQGPGGQQFLVPSNFVFLPFVPGGGGGGGNGGGSPPGGFFPRTAGELAQLTTEPPERQRQLIRLLVFLRLVQILNEGLVLPIQDVKNTTPAAPAPTPAAPFSLPPVTGLPGPTTEAWSDVSLDFLAVFNVNGIGEVMLDRFFEAGGHFGVIPGTTKTSTDARYNTDDDLIKLGTNAFNKDGSLSRQQLRSVVAVYAHEFFHAYVDQVVKAGFDPLTQQILAQGATWLAQQQLKQADKQGNIPANAPVQAGNAVLDSATKLSDFIEEYVGHMINRMVSEHLRIAGQLRDGEVDANGASQAWQRFLTKFGTEKITAYEDAESGEFEVQGGPPPFLTNHISNLFGLGYPAPAAAPATPPATTGG